MPPAEQDNPVGPPPPAVPPPNQEHDDGPGVPPALRPDREDLRRRMRRVDRDLARRYRQKPGQ